MEVSVRSCDLGLNSRFEHTFCDEDSIGWAKLLASKRTRRGQIEQALTRSARLRLRALKWRVGKLNESANLRGKR